MLYLKPSLVTREAEKSDRVVPAKTKPRARSCNLCGERFLAPSPHSCFCEDCKLHHELYRFHDWLPDILTAA